MKLKNKTNNVPEPTIRRLPLYVDVIKEFQEDNLTSISCVDIAKRLQLDPIQVRKDISFTGIVGTARVGYKTKPLIEKIYNFLSWDKSSEAVLVGSGNLGEALIRYKTFNEYGFNIINAFDIDKNKIGKKIEDINILPMENIEKTLSGRSVKYGIITVPAENAQSVVDILISNGVKGIWNFAPKVLNVPSNIYVEHVCLSSSLAVLMERVNEKIKKSELKHKIEIEICMGSSCFARGNKATLELVQSYINDNNFNDVISIKGALCKGRCKEGPIIRLNDKDYANIDAITFLDELKYQVKQEMK